MTFGKAERFSGNCWGARSYLKDERIPLLLPDSRLVHIQLSIWAPSCHTSVAPSAKSQRQLPLLFALSNWSKKHFLAPNASSDLKYQQPRSLNYCRFCQGEIWTILSVNFLLWDATFVRFICRSFPEQSAFIYTTGTSLTSWKAESYPYPIAACFHR